MYDPGYTQLLFEKLLEALEAIAAHPCFVPLFFALLILIGLRGLIWFAMKQK